MPAASFPTSMQGWATYSSGIASATGEFFSNTPERKHMNESSDSTSMTSGMSGGMSSGAGLNGNVVKRVAQKAHEAVDKLEQTVSSGSEKVVGWQEEYGGIVREQVKDNPLTAIGIAFAAGILFSRILGR